jgi:DNA modification methylase
MKPYYQDDHYGIIIYNGDCREILPQLEPVDLVLTDPPYGIFKNINSDGIMFGKPTIYSEDKKATEWDKKPEKELLITLRDFGIYFTIWGGNYFASALGDCKGTLVWNKKTGNNTYADGELAFTNTTGTMRIFNHQWCGAFKDSERNLRAIHPTQKPVQLMEWCISLCSLSNTILDPFMGSGTTLVAAKQLNRKAIGIEIEEKYCEIAVKRLQQSVLEF